jgi:hypothetical protein
MTSDPKPAAMAPEQEAIWRYSDRLPIFGKYEVDAIFAALDACRAELADLQRNAELATAEMKRRQEKLFDERDTALRELRDAKAEAERLRAVLIRIRDYKHFGMDGDYVVATLQGCAKDALEPAPVEQAAPAEEKSNG